MAAEIKVYALPYSVWACGKFSMELLLACFNLLHSPSVIAHTSPLILSLACFPLKVLQSFSSLLIGSPNLSTLTHSPSYPPPHKWPPCSSNARSVALASWKISSLTEIPSYPKYGRLSVRHFSQQLIQLPSPEQWPDRAAQSKPRIHPRLCCFPVPHLLGHPPSVDGICPQLPGLLWHRYVSVHGVYRISTTRFLSKSGM